MATTRDKPEFSRAVSATGETGGGLGFSRGNETDITPLNLSDLTPLGAHSKHSKTLEIEHGEHPKPASRQLRSGSGLGHAPRLLCRLHGRLQPIDRAGRCAADRAVPAAHGHAAGQRLRPRPAL